MTQKTYYLGRVERIVLDTKRKMTTLKEFHEESARLSEMTHPFLWDGYEDFERHTKETLADVLGEIPREFEDGEFFVVKDVNDFYKAFHFEPIFVTKEGMEAFVEANRQSGMDVSDYEKEMKRTNWDTHTFVLYAF